ncbi:MAG: efflux transporter outer membrane subunit [Verrucomicrobia bacterium]|nr:efflux transporter outer membrane subunit [Verrucomicrobiota bacterium]
MNLRRASLVALLAAWCGGCAVTSDYKPAAALGTGVMPAAFSESVTVTNAGRWKSAEPGAHLPRGAWWEMFNDAELNRLQSLAATNNQSLAAAAARFQQARALLDVSRADLYPHVTSSPSASRQRTSANVFERNAPQKAYTYNTFTLSLDSGWELDLWGRVRRQIEGAQARLAAAGDDTESARLAVLAEIAADYFTLRSLDIEYALLEQTITAYRRSLELTENRRKGGIATDLDVAQAQTQLKSAAAELPAVELQRAKLRHALATLCGQPATGFSVSPAKNPSTNSPAVPLIVPSELLERRPDIAAAERRMAAANADIGVAKTAFYPRVTLAGSAGLQSANIGSLFDWPSRLWAIGPNVQVPIFPISGLRGQLAATVANYDATVAGYRQSVLTAFQEVEDQLAAQRQLAAQIESAQAALAAARRTLEIANNRYQAGLVTYLEVATAQSAALALERIGVRLHAEQLIASVALIKASGGGWQLSAPTGN